MKSAFTGGALSFKGDKKKKKAKKKGSEGAKHSLKTRSATEEETVPATTASDDNVDDGMTEAERKALLRKRERERIELEKAASKSHRERVEEFNEKLGAQTELNDIPRVSAAGNG
jgi:protein FAM32A